MKAGDKGQPHRKEKILWNNEFVSATGNKFLSSVGHNGFSFSTYLVGCSLHCAQPGEGPITLAYDLSKVFEVHGGVRGQLFTEPKFGSITLSFLGV